MDQAINDTIRIMAIAPNGRFVKSGQLNGCESVRIAMKVAEFVMIYKRGIQSRFAKSGAKSPYEEFRLQKWSQKSAWLTRFQFGNHAPNTVAFAALDHLQGS